MPFTIGVDNAEEFNQYLINVVVTTASVAWLLLLFIRSVDKKVIVYRKPFSVAMSLQLMFVTMRNLTTMMLSSGFPIPCRWVAVVGGVIYQFFAISAECAMLIRCRSFTRYPKMLTYLTVPTWIVRLGLCLWLVTTITAPDNEAGYICDTSMDYNLSAIMQYIKIATELVILYFFLERVIALHRSSNGAETDLQWRRLALINSGITFLVILFEILVGQITVYLTGYLFLTYSLVNLIQATLVVFIVEDTRSVFKKHAEKTSASASKQTSNGQTSGQQSQPYHNQNHDDSVVTYADGLRSATPVQQTRQQQPWSLTMRTPSAMPDTIPVQYSPTRPSYSGQTSDFYDVGQMADMRVTKNRHWDVESQNTVEGNPRHWKDTEEDEIPMTLAKSREDALQQHQQQQYHTRR
ncbi:hypothetical protein EMPS_05790 [Entomortierella parvispora]|uniref:Uncharacterized protein n=1 Tax=Entomortierella parvispora TaxID=205924 RepID=A0A9P3LWU1_9FUNG|nr:hypothetical protein EMPS_05790 [Entomortierella parvispora]